MGLGLRASPCLPQLINRGIFREKSRSRKFRNGFMRWATSPTSPTSPLGPQKVAKCVPTLQSPIRPVLANLSPRFSGQFCMFANFAIMSRFVCFVADRMALEIQNTGPLSSPTPRRLLPARRAVRRDRRRLQRQRQCGRGRFPSHWHPGRRRPARRRRHRRTPRRSRQRRSCRRRPRPPRMMRRLRSGPRP